MCNGLVVFCYQNCSDLLRKKCSSDQEKNLKFTAEGKGKICTGTIYSNSERPEQFLVTRCIFNLFLDVYNLLDELEHLQFKLEKNIGI